MNHEHGLSSPRCPFRVRAWLSRWGRRSAKWFLLLLFVAGTAGSFWNLHQREEQLGREFPLQGTALQTLSLQEFRKLYSEEVVNRVLPHGIEAAHDYENRDRTIPLPATLLSELGKRISASRPGAHVRLYSDYPFPWRKEGGPRDEFEREALAALRRQPEQPFYRFEDFEGRPSLRYAVADRMEVSCVNCHNSHRDSPKTDWHLGDIRGVLEFIRPLDSTVADSRTARQWGLLFTLGMAGLGLAGLGCMYLRLQRTAASLSVSESRMRAVLDTALDCSITIDHEGKVLEFNPAAEKTFGYRRETVIGKRLQELIIPTRMRGAHERGLRHYLATGEAPVLGKRIEITALRADGTEFPAELAINVVRQNGPPLFTGYLRDLTERKQAEAQLRRREEALAERALLSALTADVALALTKSDNLKAILQHCCGAAVHHLDAAFARIWILNEKAQVLDLQASAGMYTHLDGAHSRVPVGKFKIGLIAQERKPHLTNEVLGDPRVGDQEWAQREGMVAFAGYPLLVEDRLVGVMAMFARQPLTKATLEALGVVADGVALGTVRLRAQSELEDAIGRVTQLQGLLPICSYCKKIRDDHNYWHQVERYIASHSEARFTHGVCPECWKAVVQPEFQKRGLQAPPREA
jgi:PAS domain S-box-containing protein